MKYKCDNINILKEVFIIKKSIAVLFAFVLLVLSAACGSNSGASSDKTTADDKIVTKELNGYKVQIEYSTPEKETALTVTLLNKSGKEVQKLGIQNENQRFTKEPVYLIDVTFDGYADLLIPFQRTAAAQYFMTFIWNEEAARLIYAPTFETLSNVALDNSKNEILSSFSADETTSYSISVFDSSVKDFVLQKSLYYYPDGDNMVYKEEERHDGTMQTVSEFTVTNGDDPYSIDPTAAKYYDQNSDWQLSSAKWKKYIVPVI